MSIKINNLRFSYKPDFCLDIHTTLPAKSWIIIVGNSGAGKTTLLKLLAGILTPDSGEIEYPEGDSTAGFVFQNPDDQIVQLTIEKELAFNLENKGMALAEMEKKINVFLQEYQFAGKEKVSPSKLSGGEKQRLALAATLISSPKLLIFDEPSSFLDYKQKDKLYTKIEQLKKEGKSIIWTSHELDEFMMADWIVELEGGKIKYSGEKEEYLTRFHCNREIGHD